MPMPWPRGAAGHRFSRGDRDHGPQSPRFIESLIAANRIGADVLLLNTSFAGPAMAEVIDRETENKAAAVIYDEEFTATVDRALEGNPPPSRASSRGPTPRAPISRSRS